MNILILGGTKFLGRALTEAALAKSHEVTLFHRGLHDGDAFPEVRHLIGDRNQDLDKLRQGNWDAVIDTSGYEPDAVSASTQMLKDRAAHYTFISTISAYAHLDQVQLDETATVLQVADAKDPGQLYGAKKAQCEDIVREAFPEGALLIRPGLIVGPYDASDRFTYWPARGHRGGHVLVPLPKERIVQFIDVRDLAEWTIRLIEAGVTGTVHASGSSYTMEEVAEACMSKDMGTTLTWVDEKFLVEEGVGPWMELPLWLPSDSLVGMLHMNNAKAFEMGLTTRPLADTVGDTLAWDLTRDSSVPRVAGLKSEREAQLLQQWENRG
ncbi:NAD-dependent epimerase/dehydratase family protein [Paenibacillus roseipurpureus]|uniref:NAD-dependent epimerase/dehydratase family protein n=1 Tax=Paenibacillus roseopurpureus TaxID=2918901 RepID=A0AA96RKL4_9BACL|nr:NAD-dependent epimerase/dehydratase family protein [Paenibacillus sp. MBLB1832]WNR42187.1 NAD-dependent epimerase/dehydratase family protein [Paenibacillus sp. MBLB1832]